MTAPLTSLIKPATLDLAAHIGAQLARTDLQPERYALLRRIKSHMTHAAQRRCEDAVYIATVQQ